MSLVLDINQNLRTGTHSYSNKHCTLLWLSAPPPPRPFRRLESVQAKSPAYCLGQREKQTGLKPGEMVSKCPSLAIKL